MISLTQNEITLLESRNWFDEYILQFLEENELGMIIAGYKLDRLRELKAIDQSEIDEMLFTLGIK